MNNEARRAYLLRILNTPWTPTLTFIMVNRRSDTTARHYKCLAIDGSEISDITPTVGALLDIYNVKKETLYTKGSDHHDITSNLSAELFGGKRDRLNCKLILA